MVIDFSGNVKRGSRQIRAREAAPGQVTLWGIHQDK
jgi:hypothetical protein